VPKLTLSEADELQNVADSSTCDALVRPSETPESRLPASVSVTNSVQNWTAVVHSIDNGQLHICAGASAIEGRISLLDVAAYLPEVALPGAIRVADRVPHGCKTGNTRDVQIGANGRAAYARELARVVRFLAFNQTERRLPCAIRVANSVPNASGVCHLVISRVSGSAPVSRPLYGVRHVTIMFASRDNFPSPRQDAHTLP
jgi:hypothetical protein